jgi:hypothetical protein
MDRIIVSAQRSGLNWVRLCVEKFYGRRTPGKRLLISKEDDPTPAFLRSHDALSYVRLRRKKSGAWRYVDPSDTADERVVLILRDPLETFVRAHRKSLWRFRGYVGNIRFLSLAQGDKRVVYYDELVADPAAMHSLLEFLDVTPAPRVKPPSAEDLAAAWDDAGTESRALYDVNQGRSGGAVTKHNPTDFKYHQRNLSEFERRLVWDTLRRKLSKDELGLLDRYAEAAPARPLTLAERAKAIPYYFIR